jgi:uncharacterized membrane protein
LVASVWLAMMLWVAANQQMVDRWLKADVTALDAVKQKAQDYETQHARIPSLRDFIVIVAVGFGATGVSHYASDLLTPFFRQNFPDAAQFSVHSGFFWLIVVATIIGVLLSFTPVRRLQGAGASKIGSLFVYVLVATVGLNMNVMALLDSPFFFLVGGIWMALHAIVMITMARIIRAPSFFLAVGSEANIGGAASAPATAAAFHPSLIPVGALLAVLGYIVGTFSGWMTGQAMRLISGQ